MRDTVRKTAFRRGWESGTALPAATGTFRHHVTSASDRATGASRMKGDHAVAVKRMIKGTTIAVVPSAAITEAKRRYRTP